MAIADTSPDAMLLSIRDRLIAQLPDLNADTVILADEVDPLPFPKADLFVAITPGDCQFSDAHFTGGGDEQLAMTMPVTVTVWKRSLTDKQGEAMVVLTDKQRGMFSRLARLILKALFADYEPEDGQSQLLRDQLTPVTLSAPRRQEVNKMGYWQMSLVCTATFDWDI